MCVLHSLEDHLSEIPPANHTLLYISIPIAIEILSVETNLFCFLRRANNVDANRKPIIILVLGF